MQTDPVLARYFRTPARAPTAVPFEHDAGRLALLRRQLRSMDLKLREMNQLLERLLHNSSGVFRADVDHYFELYRDWQFSVRSVGLYFPLLALAAPEGAPLLAIESVCAVNVPNQAALAPTAPGIQVDVKWLTWSDTWESLDALPNDMPPVRHFLLRHQLAHRFHKLFPGFDRTNATSFNTLLQRFSRVSDRIPFVPHLEFAIFESLVPDPDLDFRACVEAVPSLPLRMFAKHAAAAPRALPVVVLPAAAPAAVAPPAAFSGRVVVAHRRPRKAARTERAPTQ